MEEKQLILILFNGTQIYATCNCKINDTGVVTKDIRRICILLFSLGVKKFIYVYRF